MQYGTGIDSREEDIQMAHLSAALQRKAAHILLGAVGLGLLVYLLRQPYAIHPDSASYITGSMQRGPVYPLFIQLFQFLLPFCALAAVAATQTLLALGSAALLAYAMHRHLDTDSIVSHLVFLVLAAPLLKFGNSILSEALAYSLFLSFLATWLGHARCKDVRSACATIILACLAVLNRQPFLFLYIFLILYFLHDAMTGSKKRRALFFTALVLCSIGATGLARNTYNYLTFGIFGQHSAVGSNLLATQLYISEPTDIAYFDDPEQRSFFKTVSEIIEQRKLSKKNWDLTRDHYDLSMTKIYFEVLGQSYEPLVHSGAIKPAQGVANPVEMDGFFTKVGLVLLRHNIADFLLLLCRKLYDGQLFFLLQTTILTALCLVAQAQKPSPARAVYVWVSLLTLLNYAVILPGALLAPRFTFYTDVAQLAFTLAAGSALLGGTALAPSSRQA